jgi:nucleoside-diphosphate-sugar epimerase
MKILITGGTGFLGMILKKHLHKKGHEYVNMDRLGDPLDEMEGRMAVADLRDAMAVQAVFDHCGPFDIVCHIAGELAHGVTDSRAVWNSNVEGTRNLARACRAGGVKKLIFTSTNCLWGRPLNRPVKEDDLPCPVEIYGKSKLAAEKVLREFAGSFPVIIFRSSTIISSGRIGLLGILFDFIAEGRNLPVVGKDDKPYQFVCAEDYAVAIESALSYENSDTFHIGSDDPVSLKKSYQYVIDKAGSSSRIYHLPKFPTLQAMKFFHFLRLSPLGPYHCGMIAEEFVFDTDRIKKKLHWQPIKTGEEILYSAYEFYIKNREDEKKSGDSLPAHRKSSRQGIIKLLKWLS